MLALSANPLESLLIDFVNDRIPRFQAVVDNGMKSRAPVDTGRLRSAIEVTDATSATQVRIKVSVTDEEADLYGLFNDTGTSPHTISVRDAKVLTNGTDFFGTTVNHPGSTKNRGWWTDAPFEDWLAEAFE